MRIAFISDTHIRESKPPCRLDDFFAIQEEKWRLFLGADVDIWIVGGDLFDANPPSEYMKKWFIGLLNSIGEQWHKMLFVVLGQHDMEHQSIKSLDRTGIAVLEEAGYLTILGNEPVYFGDVNIYGAHFGQEPPKPLSTGHNILVWHKMVIDDKLYPGQIADSAYLTLSSHPEYKLIITGDNHQTILINAERKLVNSGSMLRLKADQINHRPCYFIYDTDTYTIEQIFFPIHLNVISREHIKIEKNNEELEKLILEMKNKGVRLNFKNNMAGFFGKNEVRPRVKDIIWTSLK